MDIGAVFNKVTDLVSEGNEKVSNIGKSDGIFSKSDLSKSYDEYVKNNEGKSLKDFYLEKIIGEDVIDKIETNKIISSYFKDLKQKSEVPETVDKKSFDADSLEKLNPEDVAEKRKEFDEIKTQLKNKWEIENGRAWPKYSEDVYSANDKLIRKAGMDYDAHHIQPLSMGGKNEVNNITPVHAENHYDRQGIHSPKSPYSQLDKKLGGNNNDN